MDAYIFDVLLGASLLYALSRGGAPEKIAASLMSSAAVTSLALYQQTLGFGMIQWGIMFVDVMLLCALGVIALIANRYWPIWLTSMQLVTVWSHIAAAMVSSHLAFAYAIASTAWSFPMLILLIGGTYRHRQRSRRFLHDPAWNAANARAILDATRRLIGVGGGPS
jgi:hypothetical protein